MNSTPPPPSDPEQAGADANGNKIDALIATLVKINNANRNADDAKEKRDERHEGQKFLIEIVEILLVAIYALFTIMEWHTFDSERKTMEQEFSAGQAVSQKQLDELQQNRVLDQRAWISETGASIAVPFNAGHIGVNFNLTNTGRTPAIIESVDMNMRITAWDKGRWSTNLFSIPTQIVSGTVAPNGLYPMNITEPLDYSGHFNVMANGQEQHLLDVKIVYKDFFGQIRHTDFGFVVCGDMNQRIVVPDETCRMD